MTKTLSVPPGCLVTLALPFLLIGLLLVGVAASALALHARSATWVSVPARVETVNLVHSGNASELQARFSYEFEGRSYSSERVLLQTGASSDPMHAERAAHLEQVKETRTTVPALVDPQNPSEALLYRELRPTTLALLSVGLLFFFVGLVVAGLLLRFARDESFRKRREKEHPNEPWKHFRQWDRSPLPSVAGQRLGVSGGITLYLALFGTPFVLLLRDGEVPGARWIIGGLVGAFVLSLAFFLRGLLSRLRHGKATLSLDRVPLTPGRSTGARVNLGTRTSPRPVRLELRCVHSTVRYRPERDDHARTEHTHRTLHSESWQLSAADWSVGPEGALLPVTLHIPAEALTSDEGSPAIRWWLELSLEGGGVGARHSFLLPVFPT